MNGLRNRFPTKTVTIYFNKIKENIISKNTDVVPDGGYTIFSSTDSKTMLISISKIAITIEILDHLDRFLYNKISPEIFPTFM